MNLKDINAEISFDLWVKPAFPTEILKTGFGYLEPDYDGLAYKLRLDGKQWKVLLRDASSGKDLNFHLKRGCAHLVEVVQVAKDDSAFLKVIFFNGEVVEIGDVEIGIDERIAETAKKNRIRHNGVDDLSSLLTNKCKISINNEDFFLILSGSAAEADFETNNKEDDDSENSRAVVQKKYRKFSIYGERVRIPVEKRNVEKEKDIFFATKVVFYDSQKSEGALRLARGKVMFTDATRAGRIRTLAAGALSQLTKEAGSYLKQWDEYGAVEGELLLARAKDVGKIEYHGAEQTIKGVKFFTSSIPDQLKVGDEIEITSEEPLYLRNSDIKWEEFSKALEAEFAKKKDQRKKGEDNNTASVFAPILNLTKTSIELKLLSIPVEGMFLVLSINGDKIQIERRMRARSAIIEGRCANPLLGLLIEEGGILPDIRRITKLKPLTPFVKEKIFKHTPTDRQIEAIEIALNTPDIALIQGPPGTGKTTVITAILERLNEEYDKTKSIRGQILVSGFQHDAVENIVSRLSVNSLPAVKFGKRSGDSDFAVDLITEKINKWCSGVADKIRTKNPQLSQTEDQVQLAELFNSYSLCPSKNNTSNLMKRILNLPRDIIPKESIIKAREIIISLRNEQRLNDHSVLRLIRALRISEPAFEDDGSARAVDLLEKIEDKLSSDDAGVLEIAAKWRGGKPLNFLPELKALKETLLYKYLHLPDFRTDKPREDILRMVADVSQLLEKKLSTTNKRDAILADFLHELEDNPDGVRRAIEDYNFVYAATIQQAEGTDIRKTKIRHGEDTVKYDTVIIDEAARTSPRDMLIPMSQAEKRIILVGDHRQLPHLIDEEVAQAYEMGRQVDVNFIKKSMFEYLFSRLKKLEEKDGIRRTVTLDAQYRTHPLLGDFVSDNFYRKYNEGYWSPLSENHFEHNLPGIEKIAAIWIDVSNIQGDNDMQQGSSRKRKSEAKVIAEYLNKWINSEAGKRLSFGVISFYKAQVSEIYEALREFGLVESAQDGTPQIIQRYRLLENGDERLRVGTVDAFQGMEFDIVFLSMVRSQNMDALPYHISNEVDYKKKQQKLFGHLMSENRLCVSMSRQKRVLAVAGDGALVNTQIAVDAVPALKNFYDLCKERGVIL